ncbi:MAG: class I SAM-dependent methyltransferase [Pseudohongiellaceae bacterium]
MISDQEYWDQFYSTTRLELEPSSFAKHVAERYLTDAMKLLELGCGNGRDSLFFARNNTEVTALDLSSKSIENLAGLNARNVEFLNQDFSTLSDFTELDCIYSRFTMHSIDDETEQRVFDQLPQVLRVGGHFFMEARSTKDESLEKVFGTDHFRRYLDFEKTVKKLEALGFSMIEKVESQGLSPYKEEDPFLIRLVAKRLR